MPATTIQQSSSNVIVIKDVEHNTVDSLILASHLDSPSNGSEISAKAEKLHIAGWILNNNWPAQLTIEVETNENRYEIELTINRMDVIKNIYDQKYNNENRSICGFSINVPMAHQFEIFIKIEGVRHLWKTILIDSDGVNQSEVSNAWLSFSSNKISDILDESITKVELLSDDLVRAFIVKKTKSGFSENDALESGAFNESERCYVSNFIKIFQSSDFCDILIQSSIENGISILSNPFGLGFSMCRESFHLKNGYTILRFVAPGDETFYIFQHVTSSDAIYFPKRRFALLDRHVSKIVIEDFVVSMCKSFGDLINYTKNSEKNRFLGIIASHGRPYHFYYDVAPAIQRLSRKNLLDKVESIVMSEGADFCSFKNIYEISSTEEMLPLKSVHDRTLEKCGFFIHVGTRFDRCDDRDVDDFDRKFVFYAKRHTESKLENELTVAKKCFPLIWFGVTGQKRAWVEQVEGYAEIISNIVKYFPDLGVVFDGWTSPLHPTIGDKAESSLDIDVILKIKELLAADVRTFSVIGLTSLEKVKFALEADVFVANSGTGSLHVSRFANRPGVGHLSKQMMHEPGFINPRLVMVPETDIIDIPDKLNNRMDYTSYSINPNVIAEMLKKIILENLLIDKFNRVAND